ncbi:hypothetical protein DFR42_106223 [Undibacterium pigrum]|uniref:Uncharacterized protein n=1 Tax=Undibacterium pigrum TaxID=401470 RepID=A0A318J4L0_9BURK|nr:hypothetical protein DFR42_106223 [Undibacterium pigrum]
MDIPPVISESSSTHLSLPSCVKIAFVISASVYALNERMSTGFYGTLAFMACINLGDGRGRGKSLLVLSDH